MQLMDGMCRITTPCIGLILLLTTPLCQSLHGYQFRQSLVLRRCDSKPAKATWPCNNCPKNSKCYNQRRALSALYIKLGWFGGGGGKNKDDDGSADESSAMARDGKGIMSIMDSMDGFRTSQRIGKMTSNIVQELSGSVVEGSAADGKVKVFFDGQQRPQSVQIDEAYFTKTDLLDFSTALTTALQDGHAKSMEKMEEKMKNFYNELGLSS